MPLYRVEIAGRTPSASPASRSQTIVARELAPIATTRLYLLELDADRAAAEALARTLLSDPIAESAFVTGGAERDTALSVPTIVEVHPKPGVMDPVADTTLAELRDEGVAVRSVRTAARHYFDVALGADEARRLALRTLANDCVDEVVVGVRALEPAPKPPVADQALRRVALRDLEDAELETLSRTGHLFLSLEEMRTIQAHFRQLDRDPTDIELETLAQTWSEHCVHKTLKSAVAYRGDAFPTAADPLPTDEQRRQYTNLLKDTIAAATDELRKAERGPECLSVFVDNAGIIAFDEDYGLALKVETHNHPSAIEPYGGAATGVGGCIRDIMGCGLGAKPIANTDVFCVAHGDWPADALPKGVLHPQRVLRGVVRGVSDYGNRMGIPTVNGAVHFDPRYLGNPLVYCGCLGLIPRELIRKAAQPGDVIVVVGGRTGRDGIHGATFSSAELTDAHADEFSHAVQIGNAITQKRVLDALLRARDHRAGCLYNAVTDCGAGGLSSAVGEMGEVVGATVELERVPLKYSGLRYDEIWISEAQERMVLAVPPDKLDALLAVCAAEEAEATAIGTFGARRTDAAGRGAAMMVMRYDGATVGELDMSFMHDGVPMRKRDAVWSANPKLASARERETRVARLGADPDARAALEALEARLGADATRSRAWIVRQYDHEVQGGSVVKPFVGAGQGPSDGAVLTPVLGGSRGAALGCGLAAELTDLDPYWMAANAVDEALRNVVCVGGDPANAAILDNFCWGRTDDPQQLGALVRTCQGAHDAAVAYSAPFISGKDSLNNEFALAADDIPGIGARLRADLGRVWSDGATAEVVADAVVAQTEARARLRIPGTLLVTALAIVDDVARCVTSALRGGDDALWLIGGQPRFALDFGRAARTHACVAEAIARGEVHACHDVSDGGWLVSVAEMALGGMRGVVLDPDADAPAPFAVMAAGYVVAAGDAMVEWARKADVACVRLGSVAAGDELTWGAASVKVRALWNAWQGESRPMR